MHLLEQLFKKLRKSPQHPPIHKKKTSPHKIRYANSWVNYSMSYLGEDPWHPVHPMPNRRATFLISDDEITVGSIIFHPDDIQWFGRYKQRYLARLDINSNGVWYQLNIHPNTDHHNFFHYLQGRLPEYLQRSRYYRRPEVRTYGKTPAHISTRNLQGYFEKHQPVDLYVTPLWMVVLHDGYVLQQHFIDDIKDIQCIPHPTDTDTQMLLLTFVVGDNTYAYALKNKDFATRLSDATRQGIDSSTIRKKKINS